MADDGGCTLEGSSPDAIRSAANLEDFDDFSRTSGIVTAEVPLRRTIRKSTSEEQLERIASTASTINNPSEHDSTCSRCSSVDTWWRASDSPEARLLRHVKVATSPVALAWERPAGAILPEWPAVDDDVASSKRLLDFEIDPTTLPTDVLCHLALKMFVSTGLPEGLAEDRVRRFILAVRASMLDNPYHNFYHVWERFALLSAALCHDMEHPGVTSQFLSKVGDSSHGGYNNLKNIWTASSFEKHHALCALGVMADPDIGILEGLSSAQYYQFRSCVSRIILATDMTRHAEYVSHLQEFAARRAEDPAVEMDKQLALELMVKCADISNVVKPAAVARRWALRVTDEFFGQGDAERAKGMEVSPNCDRPYRRPPLHPPRGRLPRLAHSAGAARLQPRVLRSLHRPRPRGRARTEASRVKS